MALTSGPAPGEGRTLIELSHTITDGMATYPGLPAPEVGLYRDHASSRSGHAGAAGFAIGRLALVGNTATYIDSPLHRDPGAPDVSQLPLARLVDLPTVVIDVREHVRRQRMIDVSLPRRSLTGHAVLFRTDWSRRWASADYWRPGPYLAHGVVERLVQQRPAIVGVDFWNIDDVGDPERPAHTHLLRDGVPIVEHLRNLDRVPPHARSSFVPLAVQGAPSLPVRAFAIWQETRAR